MLPDILPGDVGDKGPVSIAFPVHDQTALLPLRSLAEASRSQKDPQFERHVEPRQIRRGIEIDATQIVDGELAVPDQAEDLFHPYLPAILGLQGATGPEATVEDGEDDSFEEGLIVPIKRAVYEYALVVLERDDHRRD